MLKTRSTIGLLVIALAGIGGVLAQTKVVRPPSSSGVTVVRKESAFPTGDRATSVILVERLTPPEVRAGAKLDYQIRVTNLTRTDLKDVVLEEQLPANFALGATDPPAVSNTEHQIRWKWPMLRAGATEVLRVQGVPSGSGELSFCAAVTFSTVACASTNIVAPKLNLAVALPREVIVCDPITLRLSVSNIGTGALRNVRVNAALPQGLTTTDGKNSVSFDAGDLAADQTREFSVAVRAAGIGEFKVNAQAQDEGGSEVTASAAVHARQPVLVVTKIGPEYRYLGRPATFEIAVQNTGDAPARDATLVDIVPPGTEFVSADGGGQFANGQVTWALGTLEPSATRTVKLNLRAVTIGQARSTAVAKAYCAESRATASLDVRGISAVLLEMVDDPDPIEIGGTTTYTITVTNQGSADAANIAISATVPPEEDAVSCDGATRGVIADHSIKFDVLRSLAPKAKATWKVVVKGNKDADARFKVTLFSDVTGDVPVEQTESTHIY